MSGFPEQLWQAAFLINLVPEATGAVLFQELTDFVTYVTFCVAIVLLVWTLERWQAPGFLVAETGEQNGRR